ncbi:hypothetical protein BDV06DRAFT_222699 [Aspergillus oleicola]
MPPSCQQPRPAVLASLKKYGRAIRGKLKKLSPWKLNRLVQNNLSPQAAVRAPRGVRPSPADIPRMVHHFPIPSVDTQSQSASRPLGVEISTPLDILLRFRGDEPEQTEQAAASLDTQLNKINVMRGEIWDRLSEDGRRGSLEPADDVYVKPLGPGLIPVRGVVRNVEWYLKNGQITYTSDFYVVENDRFDVLIGDDTIRQYRLLEFGADVQYHLGSERRQREEAQSSIRITASDPKGHLRNTSLRAIIDERLDENIITRKRLQLLQGASELTATPLTRKEDLTDSRGVSYEATTKIRLLIRPCNGSLTNTPWFHIAETDTTHVVGGHDIILARTWKQKLGLENGDGTEHYSAAPTQLVKGKDKKKWDKDAADNAEKNKAAAAEFESEWEKGSNQQEKGKQPAN